MTSVSDCTVLGAKGHDHGEESGRMMQGRMMGKKIENPKTPSHFVPIILPVIILPFL